MRWEHDGSTQILYHLEYNRHVFAHTLRSALSLSLSFSLSLSRACSLSHSRSLSLCSPLAPTLPVSVSRSHFLTHTQTCNMEAGGSERARPIFFLPVRECIYGCHVFRWYWLKSMWTIVWNEIKLNDSIESSECWLKYRMKWMLTKVWNEVNVD